MALYQITFSFLDPTTAMGTVTANSEEEAINILKAQIESKVQNLTIDSVEEIDMDQVTLGETEAASDTIN